MSDMVKYGAAIWTFLKLTALYFTMSDIVHYFGKIEETMDLSHISLAVPT